jgi:hypothetical protein
MSKRAMMVRSLLHGISTAAAVLAMHFAHNAPMWAQMTLYGASWIGCAALYVPILYLREHLMEAMDERTRRILREELERRELVAFKRLLDCKKNDDRAPHDDGST